MVELDNIKIKQEKPKQRITNDPAHVMGLCYDDELNKLLGKENIDKYIIIKKWLPGDDAGIGRELKKGKKSHSRNKNWTSDKVLMPVIGKNITAPWGYTEEHVNAAIKAFDIFGIEPIIKIHPEKPMPLMVMPEYEIGTYEQFKIMIAPRVYEDTEAYKNWKRELKIKAEEARIKAEEAKQQASQDIGCRDSP